MREKPVFTAIATSPGQFGRMQEWLAEAQDSNFKMAS
jgi:hypothetical protein